MRMLLCFLRCGGKVLEQESVATCHSDDLADGGGCFLFQHLLPCFERDKAIALGKVG